jgi:dihydroorotate dehydrogenase
MAAPRGSLPSGDGQLTSGRIYGRSLFARSLETVHSAVRLGIPIIGGGGVWNTKDAAVMLSAGAMAVQADASLWLPKGEAA